MLGQTLYYISNKINLKASSAHYHPKKDSILLEHYRNQLPRLRCITSTSKWRIKENRFGKFKSFLTWATIFNPTYTSLSLHAVGGATWGVFGQLVATRIKWRSSCDGKSGHWRGIGLLLCVGNRVRRGGGLPVVKCSWFFSKDKSMRVPQDGLH